MKPLNVGFSGGHSSSASERHLNIGSTEGSSSGLACSFATASQRASNARRIPVHKTRGEALDRDEPGAMSEVGAAMVIGIRDSHRLSVAQASAAEAGELALLAHAPTPLRPRLDLFGILIDRVDLAGAVARIRAFLAAGTPHQIVTVNLDFLHQAERNATFRSTINDADLAVPDGMPLVWLSHIMGTPLATRVTGVDLVHASCQVAIEADVGVFFLGGEPPVATVAAARARERHPGLRVSGYSPPLGPIGPDEDARIVEMILDAKPAFLFVALGAPRQDLWIREHRERLGVPVAMGVGCVLDLLAGTVRRAPPWMQSAGFEWSYRLAQEPGRLWKRYLVDDLPLFGRLSLMALDPTRSARGVATGHFSEGLK
jgi:N-acetylglucosaminyldiphosphoundecaprenol N-acetyl-beta-D-mannosaminyltransferase